MQAQNCCVRINDQVVGHLQEVQLDWPWFRGSFIPTPAYKPYAPLFDQYAATRVPERQEELMAEILNLNLEIQGDVTGERFTTLAGKVTNGFIARLYIAEGHFRMRLLIK